MNDRIQNKELHRLEGLAIFEQLGMMISLCAYHSIYMNWTIDGIARLFIPPINMFQCALFAEQDKLVGFVTWAFLSDEISDKLKYHFENPPFDGWRSGKNLWIIDLVSPSGKTGNISRMLQNDILRNAAANSPAFALRRNVNGSVRKISTFPIVKD